MKKIISILLLISTLFLMCACDDVVSTDPTDTSTSKPTVGTPIIEDTTLKSAVGLADENGVYTVPDGITFICEGAFANDETLKEVIIPSSVTEIGSGAFYACTSLEKVTMTDSVTSIGAMAFYACLSLSDITLSENIEILRNQTFGYCQALESFTVPSKVKTIESACFYGCISIKEFVLPSTIESIGAAAFIGCISASKFTGFENTKITSISESLFSNCTALFEIKLPETVTSIGTGAFYECTNLMDIDLPSGIKEVGAVAFSYTPWYRENTDPYLIIGDGVLIKCNVNPNSASIPGTIDLTGLGIKYIGNSCFMNGSASDYGSDNGYDYHSYIKHIIVPEGVETIGAYAFFGCINTVDITLPSTLKMIGASAFYGIVNTSYSNATVSFENCTSLETIGTYAFYGCYGIKDIDLADSVKYIGSEAFTETYAYYDFIEKAAISSNIDDKYKIVAENILLWGYVGKDDTSIDVPSGVKYIAGGAYGGWMSPIVYTDYENADISEAIKVKNRITNNIKEINLPDGLLYIGDSAFVRITALSSIVIPDSVEIIDSSAFEKCGYVTSIKLGKNLVTIGSYAFANTSASSVALPDGLMALGSGAFSECTNLKELKLPENIVSLGSAIVDSSCTSLKTVYMPMSFRSSVLLLIEAQNDGMIINYYNEK